MNARASLRLLEASTPPMRLTHKESAIWYALWNANEDVVDGNLLVRAAWGSGYNWHDPDSYNRMLARSVLSGRLYILRRLLEAAGSEWRIESERNVGYKLVRKA